MTYSLFGTEIIHEQLDDEVIVANLDAGVYYSIRGSGPIIWQLLLAGYSVSEIEHQFVQKYGKSPSIAHFVDKLVQEHLLTQREVLSSPVTSNSWPETLLDPTFERYDEMKNLLMLDPIHEVDEQGWPHRK